MKINIYQINHDRDDKRLMFFGLDEVQKLTGSKMVKAEIYDKIFSGDVDCPSLEGVFHKFNYDHPAGYTGRSLSVSDVVEIVESNNTEKGFLAIGKAPPYLASWLLFFGLIGVPFSV